MAIEPSAKPLTAGRLDPSSLRSDFPILNQLINGHRLVYLDNAATSQKPRAVIDSLVHYYETMNANVNRGNHTLATRATEGYELTRSKVAAFLGAGASNEIVFTRNTTESINLVAHAWGRSNIEEGDEILISVLEHHSNIVPWQMLAAEKGARVRFAGATDDGRLDLDSLRALAGARTKLISITHMSNVLGTITPIHEVAAIARSVGAKLLVDGAQSAPHFPVDLATLGADFFACSSHKMIGPTGVGVLWAAAETLNGMEPFLGGGDMIEFVREEGSTWAEIPYKFEAGTPNIADVVAFGTAIDYLEALGMDAIDRHDREITAAALDRLARISGVTLHGPATTEDRGGVVSFTIKGVHPHDVATIMDGYGVAVRAGQHCAQPLMRRLGVVATSRASFYMYNDVDDVEALAEAIHHVQEVFA